MRLWHMIQIQIITNSFIDLVWICFASVYPNFRTVVSITASIFLLDPVKCNVLTTTWWRKLKASDLIGATNIGAVPILLYTVSPDSFFKNRAHETMKAYGS